MILFTNNCIHIATGSNVTAITSLLNSAYRGESSKQGWTTEANLIAGDTRTSEKEIKRIIVQAGSVILVYHSNDEIAGCVNLQNHQGKMYLGMLGVSPQLQGAGIGKQLLQAAEQYTLHQQCIAIYMTVISVRTELIAWYERHGYRDTGKRKSFIEDELSGKHLQKLEFMVMEKLI